jgi:hypothetical protein
MLNNILRIACATANIPAILEPDGICRDDGKKPDGLTLIPWSKGKCLLWDATCADTMASSYINSTSHSAGAAANSRELAKRRKYSGLSRLSLSLLGWRPWAHSVVRPSNSCQTWVNDFKKPLRNHVLSQI